MEREYYQDKANSRDTDPDKIYAERLRAGKRTYFFDVKATRANDYYITITERKKKYGSDSEAFEKHKIFLYKEDFNKFLKALQGSINHVKENLLPDYDFTQFDREEGTYDNSNA